MIRSAVEHISYSISSTLLSSAENNPHGQWPEPHRTLLKGAQTMPFLQECLFKNTLVHPASNPSAGNIRQDSQAKPLPKLWPFLDMFSFYLWLSVKCMWLFPQSFSNLVWASSFIPRCPLLISACLAAGQCEGLSLPCEIITRARGFSWPLEMKIKNTRILTQTGHKVLYKVSSWQLRSVILEAGNTVDLLRSLK